MKGTPPLPTDFECFDEIGNKYLFGLKAKKLVSPLESLAAEKIQHLLLFNLQIYSK